MLPYYITKHASTGYRLLMYAQSSKYRIGLCTVLSDSEWQGEYVGGYHFSIAQDVHFNHPKNADSDEQRWCHKFSPYLMLLLLRFPHFFAFLRFLPFLFRSFDRANQ